MLDALLDKIAPLVPDRAYGVVHADSAADQRGIDTAFIYDTARLGADPAAVFSHFVMRRTGTRDITQATFTTNGGGNDVVALVNHWPSRSGGATSRRGFGRWPVKRSVTGMNASARSAATTSRSWRSGTSTTTPGTRH